MNVEVGSNPLENVAVRLKDVKVRERHIAENQKTNSTSKEEIVLELSNADGVKVRNSEKVQNNVKEQSQEKKEYHAEELERRKVMDVQHILENIDI